MPYRYRKPNIKIGNTIIRRNKKGYSFSSKTLFGGRKTYNSKMPCKDNPEWFRKYL